MALVSITPLTSRSCLHKSLESSTHELKALRRTIPTLGMCRRGKSVLPSRRRSLTTAVSDDGVQRRIGNYHSNLWDDDFIQTFSTPYGAPSYCERAERLVGEIKERINSPSPEDGEVVSPLNDLLQRHSIVDSIERLGIDRHFKNEIKSALDCVDSMEISSRTVIVFDFDLTIIDCDSDPWVMEQLGATQLFQSLLPTLPWNTLMDKMMGELHEQGKTISDIEESLKTIPLYPEMIRAIKFAFSMGCDLRILSDANMFFIKTILQAHGLLQYFTDIKTNPAFVDETERLRIQPFHPFIDCLSHGCTLCPPNMCKGAIIDEMMLKSLEGELTNKKQFIYLGDGSGDFCPSLKLADEDHVLARKEYPLWKLIHKNCDVMKAQVHGWSNAKDVEDLFVKLLKP